MQANEFYQTRRADWERLTLLLTRCQANPTRLSANEVQTLGQLYRAATSDLALAQRDFPRHQVTLYLNQLVARAHAVVYHSEPLSLRRFWRFLAAGLPQLYRETFPFILAAALLFILPAGLAGFSAAWRPDTARWLLPAEVQPLIASIEAQELWTDIPVEERPYASAFIMQNNIQVAFLAFGGGVLLGLPTVWTMIYNGLILGGLTGLTAHYGIGWELWAFVIGHGVVELSVTFIAGGAGLKLGWALVRPGWLRRREALAQAAQRVVPLLVACVPLLFLAGTIEGLISPAATIPVPVKWAVGLGTGGLLYGYLLLGGRPRRSKRL